MKNRVRIVLSVLFALVATCCLAFTACTFGNNPDTPDTPDGTECVHEWGEWTETTAASCEADGEKTRTCSKCHDTDTEKIDKLNHNYGAPSYVWNATYTECEAKVVCANDASHVISEKGTITNAVTQNKTCELDELTQYTATFTNSAFTTQTVENIKTADKLNHDYSGTPTYTWNATYTECEAKIVCANDEKHVISEKGTVTNVVTQNKTCELDELTKYTATFTNSAFTTQTVENIKTADKLNHDYSGTPTYTWNATYTECVAKVVCANDASHTIIERGTVTSAVTQNKTCTLDELTKYTATFENSVFTTQTVENVKTVDKGHDYEKTSVTAPDCTNDGYTLYTCTGCGETDKRDIKKSSGHNFASYAKQSETLVEGCAYTVTYKATCGHCSESDTKTETVYKHKIVEDIDTKATCSTNGFKHKECSSCHTKVGEQYSYVDPDAHIYDRGTVDEADGTLTVYTCDCGHKKYSVNATKNESGVTSATIGSNAVNKVNEVKLENTVVALDEETKSGLIGDVTIASSEYTVANSPVTLTEEQKNKIGDAKIYNFTMKADGNSVTQFGGTVTVTIDYVLADGEDPENIVVWWITDGKVESIKATYDNGKVTFETTHFSYYTVATVTPAEKCDAFGHEWTDTNVVDATCTKNGSKVKVCSVCGATEMVVIKAKGHKNDGNGSCSECGEYIGIESANLINFLNRLASGKYTIKLTNIEVNIINSGIDASIFTALDMSFAELYLGITADGEITVYGYGTAYYVLDGIPEETFKCEATLAIYGGSIYLNASIPTLERDYNSDNYGAFEAYEMENVNMVMPLSVMIGSSTYETLNYVLPQVIEWFKTDVAPAIKNLMIINGSELNSFVYGVIDAVFAKTEVNGNVVYTLDADKLKAIAEIAVNGKISEVFDAFAGKGAFNSLVSGLNGLLNADFGTILDKLAEDGVTVEGILNSINGLMSDIVASEVDAVALISNMITQGQTTISTSDVLAFIEDEDFRNLTVIEMINMMMNQGEDSTPITAEDISGMIAQYSSFNVVELIFMMQGIEATEDDVANAKANILETVNAMIDMVDGMVSLSFTVKEDGSFVSASINCEVDISSMLPDFAVEYFKGELSFINGDNLEKDYASFIASFKEESDAISDAITEVLKDIYKNDKVYTINYANDGTIKSVTKTVEVEKNMSELFVDTVTSENVYFFALLQTMKDYVGKDTIGEYLSLYELYGSNLEVSFKKVLPEPVIQNVYFSNAYGGYSLTYKKGCNNKYYIEMNSSNYRPLDGIFGGSSMVESGYYFDLVVTLKVNDSVANKPKDTVFSAKIANMLSKLNEADFVDNLVTVFTDNEIEYNQKLLVYLVQELGYVLSDESYVSDGYELGVYMSSFKPFVLNVVTGEYETKEYSETDYYRVAHNDEYDEVRSIVPQNCSQWGKKVYKCSDCGDEYVTYYRIGHKDVEIEYIFDNPEYPDCTDGLTEIVTCKDCDEIISKQHYESGGGHIYNHMEFDFSNLGVPAADHKHTYSACACGMNYGSDCWGETGFSQEYSYYKKGENNSLELVSPSAGYIYCRECGLGYTYTSAYTTQNCLRTAVRTYTVMQFTVIGDNYEFANLYTETMNAINAKINELKKQLNSATDEMDKQLYKDEIERYEERVQYIEQEFKPVLTNLSVGNAVKDLEYYYKDLLNEAMLYLEDARRNYYSQALYPTLVREYGTTSITFGPYAYHNYEVLSVIFAKDSTCCTDGLIITRRCKDCGAERENEAYGHYGSEREVRTVLGSTCKDGVRIAYYCEFCDEYIRDYVTYDHVEYKPVEMTMDFTSSCNHTAFGYACDDCGDYKFSNVDCLLSGMSIEIYDANLQQIGYVVGYCKECGLAVYESKDVMVRENMVAKVKFVNLNANDEVTENEEETYRRVLVVEHTVNVYYQPQYN